MTKQRKPARTLYNKALHTLSRFEPYRTAWEWHLGVVMHALLDLRGEKAWERKRKPRGWDKTWPVIVNQGIIGSLAVLLNEGVPAVFGQFMEWVRSRNHKSLGEFVHDLHNAEFPRYHGQEDNPFAPLFRGRLPDGMMDARGAFEQGGWKMLQLELLLEFRRPRMAPAWRQLLSSALLESLVFERFGFVVSRCQHGDHWFVCDDRRRKDCFAHRLAGQQARWRQRHPGWKLRGWRRRGAERNRATVSAEP